MKAFSRLDDASPEQARVLLQTCCGSSRWVDRMLARRPFGRQSPLLAAAREEWFALDREDWLEAFSHHPKIGDGDALQKRFAATRHLSEREQAGVDGASDDVLDALAAGNRAYEEKFGYIFIVCATSKSATEMLGLLRNRLGNDPAVELRIAAAEQAKITEIRLHIEGEDLLPFSLLPSGRAPATDEAPASPSPFLLQGAAAGRNGLARAAQHFSRRRHQPVEGVWNRSTGLTRPTPTKRAPCSRPAPARRD
jgi:2-oxo-4-hydroxy-4-carboxy-5-ureidoimidazoline decarboxylase